jgi:hypothetical protein
MEEQVIIRLIDKYLEGTATAGEVNELDQWYNSFNDRAALYHCGTVETKDIVIGGFAALKAKLELDNNT